MTDPTQRFTDRVAWYLRGRPGYPAALVALCRDRLGLPDGGVVVDLGSGTGLLSAPLVAAGARVYGVEPNAAMAAPARDTLGPTGRFHDVRARAEATGLPDQIAHLVTAGQAFHWFEPAAAAAECRRILRPGGQALLAWNLRRIDASPFSRAYEAFLVEHGTDYLEVSADKAAFDGIEAFFGGPPAGAATFDNHQRLDRAGFRARVLSCSYIPSEGHPRRAAMMAAMDALFDAYAADRHVTLVYDTRAFWGWPAG